MLCTLCTYGLNPSIAWLNFSCFSTRFWLLWLHKLRKEIWFCFCSCALMLSDFLYKIQFVTTWVGLRIIWCIRHTKATISIQLSWFDLRLNPIIWFINPLSISWCDFFLIRVWVKECEIQWRTFNSGGLNWDCRTDYCRHRSYCCWFCCSFYLFSRHCKRKISKLLAQFNAVIYK